VTRGRGSSTGGRTAGASQETRTRILEATLDTIRTEGMLGASARAIARTGKFNQASIYYHFGSINEAVVAAITHMSEERLARYEKRLDEVASLSALVEVAAELHREDVESGTIHVMSQVMAAAAGDGQFADAIGRVFESWIDVVRRALAQALDGTPLASVLPLDELAFAVSASFVGIELLGQLGGDTDRSEQLFAAVGGLARVFEAVLPFTPPLPAAAPAPTAARPTPAERAAGAG
jgi:AcrR family transcriptional regulator